MGTKPKRTKAAKSNLKAADEAQPHVSSAEAVAAVVSTDLRRVHIDPDFWYPLAWSKDLKRGKTIGRRFGQFPIALVRPEEGSVFALEDRCAHRQIPLSLGKVSGEAVQCCYHGWAYGRSGRCIDVPYLGKGKLPNGVKTYPCREAGGLIFVFPGDPVKADSVPLPVLAQVDNPAFKTRQFSPMVKCHYTFMHENLMDMNHQFLHRRQMGQIRARFLGQDSGEGFIEARYSFARTGTHQPLAERLIFGKHHDDPEREQPVEEVVSVRTTYPYQSLKIHDKDGDLIMELFSVYVPNSADGMSTQVFGLLSVLRPKTPFLIDVIWPALGIFTNRIFEEDREIMELEQAAWCEQGGDRNVEVFPIVRKLRELLLRSGRTAGTDIRPVEDVREQASASVVV